MKIETVFQILTPSEVDHAKQDYGWNKETWRTRFIERCPVGRLPAGTGPNEMADALADYFERL